MITLKENFSNTTSFFHDYSEEDLKWYIVATRTRDSVLLDRCNFDAMVEIVGHQEDEEFNTLTKDTRIDSMSHYICGFIEYLLVAPDSPAYYKALDFFEENEGEFIYNEDEYSRREHEEIHQLWHEWSRKERYGVCKASGLSAGQARRARDFSWFPPCELDEYGNLYETLSVYVNE